MNGFELYINDRIRNRKIEFFNGFSLDLRYDSVGSSFGFSVYFNPDDPEHKDALCVSHYHRVEVKFNGELLLTGIITNQRFSQNENKQLSSVGGYSLTGVLQDCSPDPRSYPLQFNGLSLSEITSKLLRPFNLDFVVDDSVKDKVNKSFKKSTPQATSKIKDYLTGLASQKDIVITHNEKGELLFTEVKTDLKPIMFFDLTSGVLTGTNYDIDFNGTQIHSHITVMKQPSISGGNKGQVTIRNPYVIGGYYRPIVITQNSGDDVDTAEAAKRALANELENIKLTITTDRWLIGGKIIKPNSIISVLAPHLYLYKKIDWFVQSIKYTGGPEKTTAVLTCVLPEVYNGKTPISIYSGINLH